MSIVVNAPPTENEVKIPTAAREKRPRRLPMPIGEVGLVCLATFMLAAVLFWAISILAGIL